MRGAAWCGALQLVFLVGWCRCCWVNPSSLLVCWQVPYYRFRQVAGDLDVTPPFALGYGFGSALVQPANESVSGQDTMWVFGTDHNQTYVDAFHSTDLVNWTQSRALQLQWGDK